MDLNTTTIEEFPMILEEVKADLAERSLHEFVRASWPILHPATRFTDGWHIEALCVHLEALISGEIKKLLVNLAPRMTKSIIASVDLPPWAWTQDPSMTFLYTSYSSDLASEHSLLCRRLVESDWYRKHWGYKFKLTTDQREKMHFDNDCHGSRAAFGMTSVSGHGALINVCDDPHDREDWKHPNEIKRSIDAYDSGIYNAVTDPVNARRLVLGQRVTAGDLTAHLKAQGGWEELIIPTEYDPKRSKVTVIGWKDRRKIPGELACPKRWGRDEVNVVKRNARLFSAYHQQDPSADEGAIFKRPDWCYYADDPKDAVGQMQAVIQSWDLTSGGPEPGTSKVSGQVWGKLNARKFLLDRVLDYMDTPQTLTAIRGMCARWPQARAKVVETKAAGNSVISLLQKEIPGIIPWPPKGDKMDSKVTRALSIQPEHQGHNLYLPDPTKYPWVQEFVEYCVAFPNGEFDDDVDSMVQALMYLERIPSTTSVPLAVGQATRWLK